jgi:hypothetical protein
MCKKKKEGKTEVKRKNICKSSKKRRKKYKEYGTLVLPYCGASVKYVINFTQGRRREGNLVFEPLYKDNPAYSSACSFPELLNYALTNSQSIL